MIDRREERLEEERAPEYVPGPTPAGRRAARIFVGVFAVVMIGTFIFSTVVSRDVRRNAARTDRQVRIATWAILVHVDRAGGFPTSRGALDDPFTSSIAADTMSPPRWPATIDAAGLADVAATWRADLDAALDRLDVQFPPDGRQPPNVTPAGNPTELGTLADANAWLRGRADALAVAARGGDASARSRP